MNGLPGVDFGLLIVLIGTALAAGGCSGNRAPEAVPNAAPVTPANIVRLTDEQLKSIKVASAAMHDFVVRREAVGIIDFNQDRNVPVVAPYQGRIKDVQVALGEDVRRGDVLYTIESSDLIQAESTLIGTAGVLQLTTNALERAKRLYGFESSAQKDIEQATSDQQTAAANYAAARNTLRNVFGKSETEIERIVAHRAVDGTLAVTSPMDGRITARTAALGMFVQQGATPAPITVTDISTMWMVGYVAESDIGLVHRGDLVAVGVPAYPGRTFTAKLTTIGTTVDPVTHRFSVRAEIADPQHELLPQMLATFTIQTSMPRRVVAVPANGIVREGDGTLSAWVTTDGHAFAKRVVQVGLIEDGVDEISSGLHEGEMVVTDGAVFVSNMLSAPPTD